mgnify:CR=1 FL=1
MFVTNTNSDEPDVHRDMQVSIGLYKQIIFG